MRPTLPSRVRSLAGRQRVPSAISVFPTSRARQPWIRHERIPRPLAPRGDSTSHRLGSPDVGGWRSPRLMLRFGHKRAYFYLERLHRDVPALSATLRTGEHSRLVLLEAGQATARNGALDCRWPMRRRVRHGQREIF